MTWQPIKTAPKDGTRILLYRAVWAESMAVGWWHSGYRDWQPVNGDSFLEATHWMPLPDPPEVKGG